MVTLLSNNTITNNPMTANFIYAISSFLNLLS